VYVRFDQVTAAQAAQKALHGRWFAGKQVCAEFQFVAPYTQRFGAWRRCWQRRWHDDHRWHDV